MPAEGPDRVINTRVNASPFSVRLAFSFSFSFLPTTIVVLYRSVGSSSCDVSSSPDNEEMLCYYYYGTTYCGKKAEATPQPQLQLLHAAYTYYAALTHARPCTARARREIEKRLCSVLVGIRAERDQTV